jgi:iron complex transport system substrate-binding protein
VPFASPPVSAPATGTLTRRRFLGAAGLGVLLTVPACAERPGSAPAPQASRTFDGAFGPIEAPVAPQRVASTDFYTAYALLDVGFTVAPDGRGDRRGRVPRQLCRGHETTRCACTSR